jgi:hypothetical protein
MYDVVSLSFTEWLNSLMEIQGSMLQGKAQKLEEMGRGLTHQTALHGFNRENYSLTLILLMWRI